MPLLVPVAIALVVILGGCMSWAHLRYVLQRRYGAVHATIVAAIAASGIWVLVASQSDTAPDALEMLGWVLLAVSAVVLLGGWLTLRALSPPRAR